ncbi:MAG: EAL domain-containing protein, partial [Gammaproteobacteria bacterium]|nr:EAL domain-containing protein [Gammaproteobacteria bacterium]
KIDRSFISELNDVANDQIMVSSILNMAKQFNLKVVAEGVENKDQLDFLQSRQCDVYQGFYYSKPLTDDDFQNFYKNQ